MASLAHQLPTSCRVSASAPGWRARPREEIASRAGALLRLWRWRMRERTELSRLDDRDLRDIGLTRADVARLLAKPFWRA